jgi:hypothetical protein
MRKESGSCEPIAGRTHRSRVLVISMGGHRFLGGSVLVFYWIGGRILQLQVGSFSMSSQKKSVAPSKIS